MRRRSCLAGLVLALASVATAADFTGKFHAPNDALVIELKSAGGDQYTGTITGGGRASDLTATSDGQKITGKFTSGAISYAFDGTLDGDQLVVSTGGASYVMNRPAAAGGGNPFGAGSATATKAADGKPAAANPAAAPPAPADEVIPPEGKVLAVTPSGRTLFFVFPDCKDADSAIRAVVPAINKRLEATVKLGSAFVDTKNPACGSGSFKVTNAQGLYRGTILCGPATAGIAVSIIYSKEGAPAGDITALLAALPSSTKTETYDYPDGSGTLELPEGWTVENKTLADPLFIKGPNHQSLLLGGALLVNAPDGMLMTMYNKNVAFARAHGFAPPPPMKGIIVAPFSKPSEAMKVITPQMNQLSRDAGKPWSELVEITDVKDTPNQLPHGQAQTIDALGTLIDGETRTAMRSQAIYEAAPTGPGAWMLSAPIVMSAEKDRFPGDAITMFAIIKSIRPNQQVLSQIFEQRMEANREMTEEQRREARERYKAQVNAHDAQIAGYDEHNRQWHDQEIAKDKSAKDFIEYVRGYRTVEDTQTGKTKDIDLSDIKGTMDELNKAEPGRYQERPLRDQ